MAGHEPPDVRPLPRQRDHQPVRGLRRPRRTRLGRLPREVREHPAARPDPACGGRRPQPIQGRQAARHGDALLPLHARGTTRDLRAAGYDYRPGTAARTIAYYDRRTSHGSTLSFVTYAGVLAALDPESSWDRFLVALRSDVDDIQDGTTKEGIHMGVMAGTLDVVQRYYAGTHIRDSVLYFDPRLPSGLGDLSFPMQFRETPILVTLSSDRLTLAVGPEGASHLIRAGIPGDVRELRLGDQAVFELSRGVPANMPPVAD